MTTTNNCTTTAEAIERERQLATRVRLAEIAVRFFTILGRPKS